MSFTEKTISSEEIYKGKIITVKKDMVELCNGRVTSRELVVHPGGVAVVAMDDDKNIYMVKQYRKPFEKEILELPAGKLEKGEDPELAGLRELKEETGLSCSSFISLGKCISSPGFLDEVIYLYLATGLTKGEMELDEGEFLNVYKYNIDELLDMIKKDELIDAKSICGILKAYNKLF